MFRRVCLAVAAVAATMAMPAVAAADWSQQRSGTSEWLAGVTCPTANECWAAGSGGTIVHTDDAGLNWAEQESGTSDALHGIACSSAVDCFTVDYPSGSVRRTSNGGRSWSKVYGTPDGGFLLDVACPAANRCYAVGQYGRVITTDPTAGTAWTQQRAVVTELPLYAVACPSAQVCFAGGEGGRILRRSGGSWSTQSSVFPAAEVVKGIACADDSHCVAVGNNGSIGRTANGGWTWTVRNLGLPGLAGVACPTVERCFLSGGGGRLLETDDGGVTWAVDTSSTDQDLSAIACVTGHACWVAGDQGTILTNAPVEGCSNGQSGVPPLCLEESVVVPTVPSDDCAVGAETVLVDGYVGSLYARLRTKDEGSETWVCTRLQPEGGTEYVGGKFVAAGQLDPALPDGDGGACARQPGYSHLTGGTLDGEPYSLDTWLGDNDAWVCLVAAGTGARVALGTAVRSLPFQQDSAALATSPPRTPWTPGAPSADCETQLGGTKTRLLNATFADVHVWLTAWRSGSKTQICVRAEQGSTAAGGRFTIDSDPGVTPVLERGTDTVGCTRDVFSNDTTQLAITRSENNANPASICVKQGVSVIRLSAGYSGTVNPNMVAWTKD